ncbi:MAG: tRNA lysidine(34) synthetase TilS [Saprospiraceae bacterium]|nr:tRNA lysidine(34) synthetase TilS [Saprospiraceae bacterium]
MAAETDRPVLLAVSGGLDSCVMAELFHRSGLPFAIAHANFQLRDEESEQDERFVGAMAARMGVPYFAKKFETLEISRQNGWSTQLAARNIRYAWFSELTRHHLYAGVCTAHHLNDSLETVLLNFTRGTSLPGLSGIPVVKVFDGDSPFSGLKVIRPMLFTDRKKLESFAQEQGISWREDRSNTTDDYARNLIRHKVVPVLETLNPNILDTAARNMRRIRSANQNLDFLLQQFVRMENGQILLDKARLGQLPSPRQALRQLLKSYGFDAEQTRQMSEQLTESGTEWQSSKGFTALMDRSSLIVYATGSQQKNEPSILIQENDLMVRLPDDTRMFFIHAERQTGEVTANDDPYKITVDASALRFPLLLRRWQPGDSFQPLGMKGKHQKLQDFFTNQKLSLLQKDQAWLLVNQDSAIIWVLGLRLDERFKLLPSTERICSIHWIT